MGAEGKYDLALAPSHDPDKLQKHLAAVKGASAGAIGGVPAVGIVTKPKGLTAADAAKSKVSKNILFLWEFSKIQQVLGMIIRFTDH